MASQITGITAEHSFFACQYSNKASTSSPIAAFAMGTLPKYIAATLSEFLDQEELFSCFLVNKHWNQMFTASEIWQNLCMRKLGFLPEIKAAKEKYLEESGIVLQAYAKKKSLACAGTIHIPNGEIPFFLQAYGGKIIVGLKKGVIQVWDKKSKALLKTYAEHRAELNLLEVRKSWIVSCSLDRKIKFWDWESDKSIKTVEINQIFSNCCASENYLFGCSSNGVNMLTLETGELVRNFNGHKTWITCCQVFASTLVTAARDKSIKIWNWETGSCLKTLEISEEVIGCMQINHQYFIGSSLNSIKIWDFQSLTPLWTINPKMMQVTTLALKGNLLISDFGDGTLRFWALKTGIMIHSLKAHKYGRIRAIAFDGNTLLSCADDHAIQISEKMN